MCMAYVSMKLFPFCSVCTSSIQAATVWHRFTAKLPHVVNQNFPQLKDLKLCTNYQTFQSSPCVKELGSTIVAAIH